MAPIGYQDLARGSKGTLPMRFLRFLPAPLLAGFLSLHGADSARAATVTPFTEQAFKSAMRSSLFVFQGVILKRVSVGDTAPLSILSPCSRTAADATRARPMAAPPGFTAPGCQAGTRTMI